MARSQGVNDRLLTVLCLASPRMAGLGAALTVQYQGYADVNMGTGTFVAGVGAVLLGELLSAERFQDHPHRRLRPGWHARLPTRP